LNETQRFSDEQIRKLRKLAADKRRMLFWAIPLALLLLSLLFFGEHTATFGGWLFVLSVIGLAIGIAIYRRPQTLINRHDPILKTWDAMVMRSDPDALLLADFPLMQDEVIYYAERGQRFEERKTGEIVNTQTRTKNAVGSALIGGLLFGPAGAIVGGGMARKQTVGTSTDVYGVVAVDDGEIAVTSARFIFMGQRDTLEVPTEKIMRLTSIDGTDRLLVEYSGRKPGESYSVSPLLFALCMARRAEHKSFLIPDPPPPLSMSNAVKAALAPSPIS